MSAYQEITDKIVAELKKGVVAWQKPWIGTYAGAYNVVSKKSYSILNQMLLKHADGYASFKQIQAMGGKVKKGAKAERVFFFKMVQKSELGQDDDGEDALVLSTIPILKSYPVFWIGDAEGIELAPREEFHADPIEAAEAIIGLYADDNPGLKINITESDRAFYRPSDDSITVPEMSQYPAVEEFYSTLFHEMVHSTGAAHRLDRISKKAFFGNDDYSKEELVAEIGAAMLVNAAGIDSEKCFKNSVAYINAWMSRLQSDPRLIVSAASAAEKAVKYILNEGEAAVAA